jgi:Holliday junction resolvase RusA-like endonuclease
MKPEDISFSLRGTPKAQPRARSRSGMKGVYNPQTADLWKRRIIRVIEERIKIQFPNYPGAICFSATFIFPRPKSHFYARKNERTLRASAPVFHTKKPDTDNLLKALKDAISQTKVWKDDSQVCLYGGISKDWTEDEVGGMEVEIVFLENLKQKEK